MQPGPQTEQSPFFPTQHQQNTEPVFTTRNHNQNKIRINVGQGSDIKSVVSTASEGFNRRRVIEKRKLVLERGCRSIMALDALRAMDKICMIVYLLQRSNKDSNGNEYNSGVFGTASKRYILADLVIFQLSVTIMSIVCFLASTSTMLMLANFM